MYADHPSLYCPALLHHSLLAVCLDPKSSERYLFRISILVSFFRRKMSIERTLIIVHQERLCAHKSSKSFDVGGALQLLRFDTSTARKYL